MRLIYILGGLACFIAIAKIVSDFRMRKHRGVARSEFIAAFNGTGIPEEIPAIVYDYYKGEAIFKGFSVAPDDSFEQVLHKGEEDIDDDARLLMKQLSLKPPTEEVWFQWSEKVLTARRESLSTVSLRTDSSQWMQSIQTLRDMVVWLDCVRQHQPS
jgi:hypothetical protein